LVALLINIRKGIMIMGNSINDLSVDSPDWWR